MSKCKVFLASTVVVALFTCSAQALLVSFDADVSSTWNPSGAVIQTDSPGAVTITAESHSVFSITSTTTNNTGFTWTSYELTLDPAEAATFVPGTAQSTDFQSFIDHDPYTLEFTSPLEVPPGEQVTFEVDIDLPDTGPFTFTLTQTPIPEPATVALLGLGALALVARRKKS